MITAKVQFLSSTAVLDLSLPPYKVQEQLQSAGVLTVPDMIMLNNARTLKISLYPEDSMGERIISLIDTDKNTLGEVNSLCHHIYGMDYRDELKFSRSVDSGEVCDIKEALKLAEKLKEQRRIRKKAVQR